MRRYQKLEIFKVPVLHFSTDNLGTIERDSTCYLLHQLVACMYETDVDYFKGFSSPKIRLNWRSAGHIAREIGCRPIPFAIRSLALLICAFLCVSTETVRSNTEPQIPLPRPCRQPL